VRYFNESFLAATGTVEQIEKLSRPLGVIFERGEDSNGNYAINHSSSILLLSPDGALVAKFPSSVETPEDIVSDFRKIRGYYGG
jgi:protein SCO1/2